MCVEDFEMNNDGTIKVDTKPTNYKKVKDGGVFACDVDDTLLMWDSGQHRGRRVTTNVDGVKEEHVVNEPALAHLKKMKARGYAIVVWSAGGSDWAEAAVKALEIEDIVDVIMPKIDFHLDDVDDPKDKLGSWQYICPKGKVWKKDRDGNIVERLNDLIHERTNKILEE